MKNLCIIASSPASVVAFWRTTIDKLSKDFNVYVVANYDDESFFDCLSIKGCKSVNIERRPTIMSSLKAVRDLYIFFKEKNIDGFLTQSSNASLVASIAGILAGVKFRARVFTGQIWANRKGLFRFVFKTIDRITVWLNTDSLVDGRSQQEYLIENGILKENNSLVLANGSICGVDTELFKPNTEVRAEERQNLGFGENDVVFVFLGRINRDKGTYELLEAFDKLASQESNAKLLLIGPTEGVTDETFSSNKYIKLGDNLKLYGFTREPNKALLAGDIFCLPSYREGFGMSAIEAASVGLPVICSDAYGMRDSFADGGTGLKCKKMDADSLYNCMQKLYEDKDLRVKFGKAGRQRIIDMFSKELVSSAWHEYLLHKVK